MAKVVVEPAGHRVVWPLAAIVPFAKGAGGVAGGLKRLGDRPLVQVHPLLACRDPADARSRMIAPGQQFRPRGRAHGTDVEAIERHAVAGQRIDGGRADLQIAVPAVVAPARVVREEDDHVGTRRGGNGVKCASEQNRQEHADDLDCVHDNSP